MKYLAIAILAVTLATGFLSVKASAQQKPVPTLDELRANRFAIIDLKGKQVDLSKLIGQGKPVIIDIWATWCGPCRQEIPHLVELTKQFRGEGLIVIGLTLEDPQEDRQKVRNFVKEFKMNYQVGFAPEGLYVFFNGDVTRMLIPQTYIYGADGKLIKRFIGYNEKIGRDILYNSVTQAVRGK